MSISTDTGRRDKAATTMPTTIMTPRRNSNNKDMQHYQAEVAEDGRKIPEMPSPPRTSAGGAVMTTKNTAGHGMSQASNGAAGGGGGDGERGGSGGLGRSRQMALAAVPKGEGGGGGVVGGGVDAATDWPLEFVSEEEYSKVSMCGVLRARMRRCNVGARNGRLGVFVGLILSNAWPESCCVFEH